MEENRSGGIDLIGYEWEYARELAEEAGLELRMILTSPPRGRGTGSLRIIRQQERDGIILCTCAAEDWGNTQW